MGRSRLVSGSDQQPPVTTDLTRRREQPLERARSFTLRSGARGFTRSLETEGGQGVRAPQEIRSRAPRAHLPNYHQ